MNKKDTFTLIFAIMLLCICCYLLGKEHAPGQVKEKIIKVEVEVNDKGFCVSCYKKHNYDEMYILMNQILNDK